MYESIRRPDWKWFENVLAYGNARLPQAMLLVGSACSDDRMVSAGLEALDWLAETQRCETNGHFVPIGSQGFYRQGGEKARFDQQPIEAAGAVSACLQAYRVTGDSRWRNEAWSAFNWFLGDNDLQLPLYDSVTGGCRDGLHPDRANENQGAESTLSFLMALLEMRSLQESEQKKSLMTISRRKAYERFQHSLRTTASSPSWQPDPDAQGLAILHQQRVQCGRDAAGGWHHAAALPRGRPPRLVASLRRALSQRRRWMADRSANRHDAQPEEYPEEIWGIEDPRITFVPELQQYVVTYTSYSRGGPGVSLALTKDFRTFERYGVIMPPDDKDSALLPRRIDGCWALIHRPMTPLGSHMWISYSPDLRYWGRHRLMLEARRGAWWDANKIGLSPPPIETSRGWLVFYHGVRHTPSGCLYRLGLALFDLENPEKCLLRGDSWIFGPEAEYERHGDVDDVVFPCGYTMDADGDTSTSITELRIARLPWLGPAFALCWMAGCQWKLRTPAASAGFVNLLLSVFSLSLAAVTGT
jgi:predicted GH43/DUF377 family glycosyl hydrolase